MSKSRAQTTQKGFTLIEILIVIGIIAILAAIVLVAVNPAKNFREAANTQRSANINSIINAIGQYTVDNKGVTAGLKLPGKNAGTVAISEAGMDKSGTGDSYTGDFETFCHELVPAFIGAIPADPKLTDQSISESECNVSSSNPDTGYTISVDSNGHITITAPNTVKISDGTVDTSNPISITR